MAMCKLPRLELEQRCRDLECRLQTASVQLQREKARRKDSERKVALLQDAVGTPVHYAAKEGQVHILRILADAGADIEAGNALGHSPLHLAASRGHTESCRLLLDRGAEPTITDDCGGTALHYAAGGGHLEVVELLVEYGAPVDARTEDEGTPLHWAAGGGHLKVVWSLVQSGADITSRDCNGRTPEDVADKLHTYVADWLRDWQKGNVLTILSSSTPPLETCWR